MHGDGRRALRRTADAPGKDTGSRGAAVTKNGAWAGHLLIEAADLVPAPAEMAAETLLVNGITAGQRRHRTVVIVPGT